MDMLGYQRFSGANEWPGAGAPTRLALILMGDWCDSGYEVDTATRENSDAVKRSGW